MVSLTVCLFCASAMLSLKLSLSSQLESRNRNASHSSFIIRSCFVYSRIPNKYAWRFIIIYESPALAWLISSQCLLKYPSIFLPLGFYLFYVCMPFFIHCWLCSWEADLSVLFLLTVLDPPPQISPIYSLCLPAPPIFFPAPLLAVYLFIRPSAVLDRQRITAS